MQRRINNSAETTERNRGRKSCYLPLYVDDRDSIYGTPSLSLSLSLSLVEFEKFIAMENCGNWDEFPDLLSWISENKTPWQSLSTFPRLGKN